MYEEYYGFVEKPFSLTPDPKYLYKSESHASAFELLQYAIRRREGFVVVTGDIGTGKTTLCRAVLEQIDRTTFTALVLNPFLSEEDLLKLILQDFGVVSREEVKRGALARSSKQELIETLYDFLLSLLPIRASAVLIIDEAQNLPLQVLEQIRILSNLETDKEKLLQIVLVGQLNLRPLLRSPELRQLDQRVSIRYQLKPLTREETGAYIGHRLTIASGSTQVNFAPKAVDVVHRVSGGIPRLINLICDRALFGAFSVRTSRVTAPMVLKAAESLELPAARPARWTWSRKRWVMMTGASALAASIGAGGASVLGHRLRGGPDGAPPQQQADRHDGDVAAESKPLEAKPPDSQAMAQTPVADPPPVAPVGAGVPGQSSVAPAAPPALPDNRYTILVASFPSAAETTAAQIAALTARLQHAGYAVYYADVDLGTRGQWRRVLVGAYTDVMEARREEAHLRQTAGFEEARVITSAFATADAKPRQSSGG